MKLRKVALDCMISPRFATALGALYGDQGFEFTLVQDLVPPRADDDHWSDVFKRFGGEFVISGDTKIAYKPKLACSFIDNGFVSIFMNTPWQDMAFSLQIAYLVYWWPHFAAHFVGSDVGTLWRVPCESAGGTLKLSKGAFKQLRLPEHVLDQARSRRGTG